MQLLDVVRERRRELVTVAGALTVLLAAAPQVVEAGSVAWVQDTGVIYAVAAALDSVLPGNIDVPVALLAGILSGWLVLFAIDSTKRIQFMLLTPVVVVLLWYLNRFEHVVSTIGRAPGYFVASFVVTVAVTGIFTSEFWLQKSIRQRRLLDFARSVQFQAAVYGLYAALTLLIIIVATQYPFVPTSNGDPGPLVVAVSAIGSIAGLSVFVQYTDQKHIVGVAPFGPNEKETAVYVFGGLYDVAKEQYEGLPLDDVSEEKLEKTLSRPNEMMEQGFNGPVKFKYLPNSILKRRILFSTKGLTTADIDADELERIVTNPLLKGRYYVRSYGTLVLPEIVQTRLVSSDTIDELFRADTVLLMTPFPEPGDEEAITTMARVLCLLNANIQTTAKLVITHADRAIDGDEEINYEDRIDKSWVLGQITQDMSSETSKEVIERIRNESSLISHVHLVSGQIRSPERRGFETILRGL